MATKNAVGNSLTGSTGTGTFVGASSPTLVTPLLGTPTSGVLTNCTGLPVVGGGTGIATTTPYSVICAGTTATGAFQSLAALGPAGARLTSNGSSALPSMKGGSTVFFVGRSGTQAIAASTVTKVQLNSESFDTGAYFDNATNYRFTPLVAGYYFIAARTTYETTWVSGSNIATVIGKNGSGVFSGAYTVSLVTSAVSVSVMATVFLNGSTDYLELFAFQSDAVSRNLDGDSSATFMTGYLVEPT